MESFSAASAIEEYYYGSIRIASTSSHLIRIVDGDAKRVMSIADRSGAELGVRGNYDAGLPLRYETFGEMAEAAAAGNSVIPIARKFPLEEWRQAMEISVSARARGKLVLVPAHS